jgi:glycosyltransferase involved in cell wall biosynthesis
MKDASLSPLSVVHMMRTYGAHGGEQQLSQYFSAEPRGAVRETFVFPYRDPECSHLFRERAPQLEQLELWRHARKTGTAWFELATLLPLLPLLQARFLSYMRRQRPAVCIVHGFQAALVAWPAAMLLRAIRWGYVHHITKSSLGSNPLFRLIYRPFTVVAGNSEAVTASLAKLTAPERLMTLDNGLDWRGFEARLKAGPQAPLPAVSGPVIVSVGRLLPHKGQALLLDAFSRIAARHPGAALWIVGDGPEMHALRQRTAGLAAADRIRLLGRRGDVPAILACATIFVNASSWEGMSNAVLEGMAAGLPSVIADAPGVSECHVNGETGLVVARDAAALAAGLDRLLADPELRAGMGKAARHRVRFRYSMEANRRRYLELFAKLTGRDLCAES